MLWRHAIRRFVKRDEKKKKKKKKTRWHVPVTTKHVDINLCEKEWKSVRRHEAWSLRFPLINKKSHPRGGSRIFETGVQICWGEFDLINLPNFFPKMPAKLRVFYPPNPTPWTTKSRTAPHRTAPYTITLDRTAPHRIVLYRTILYRIVPCHLLFPTLPYPTVQNPTVPYPTIPYPTVSYPTLLYKIDSPPVTCPTLIDHIELIPPALSYTPPIIYHTDTLPYTSLIYHIE